MLFRTLALVAAGVCAGCAQPSLGPPLALQNAPEATAPEGGEDLLAARVLAAMALERSTGRTPDPARLNDIQ